LQETAYELPQDNPRLAREVQRCLKLYGLPAPALPSSCDNSASEVVMIATYSPCTTEMTPRKGVLLHSAGSHGFANLHGTKDPRPEHMRATHKRWNAAVLRSEYTTAGVQNMMVQDACFGLAMAHAHSRQKQW
jgi:hypothetical protein